MIVVDQFLTALLEEGQVLLGEIRGSKDWSLYGKRIGPIPGSVVSNGGRYIDVALCIDSNQEKVLGMVSHKMSIVTIFSAKFYQKNQWSLILVHV